jgi:hypothetical protein
MIGTGPHSTDEGDYPGNMPEDRAAFVFEMAAWGADEEQLRTALEGMDEEDVRRIAAISAKVYQASRDTWYDLVTVGAVRVLPLPKNI